VGPRTTRRSPSGDDGASAVEFALLLPVFAMLVFGMISAGFAFQAWLSATHGAQETARFAATLSIPASGGSTSTWLTSVGQRAMVAGSLGTSSNAIPGTQVCVALFAQGNVPKVDPASKVVLTADSAGTVTAAYSTGPCAGMPAPGGTDWVQVFLSRPAAFNYILGSATVTVAGKSSSRFEAVSLS